MSNLTKETSTKIEVVGEFRAVQVLEMTQVFEDGVALGNPSNNRYVIQAGDDYSEQPEEIQAVCAAVHTPEVIAAFRATQSND